MFALNRRVRRNSFMWCSVAFLSYSVDCGARGGQVG